MATINQWLQGNGMTVAQGRGPRTIDINNNPYFGTGGAAAPGGGGWRGNSPSESQGSGQGYDFMDWSGIPGLERFYDPGMQAGDASTDPRIRNEDLSSYLQDTGFRIREADVVGQWGGRPANWVRWMEDAQGNIIGTPTAIQNTSSSDLRNVALVMAMAAGGAAANGGWGYGTFNPAPGAVGAAGGATGGAAGGAAGGTAGAGAGGGAATAAADPIGAYLTTGAVEGSTIGGAAAGGGGAGAVGAGSAAAAAGGSGGGMLSSVGGDATRGALYSNSGYGAGMSGAQTGVFDTVLGATGSTSLASTASNFAGAFDWLSSLGDAIEVGGNLFSNPLVNTLIGAGVQQYNLERAAREQREWQEQQDANRRRRQAPVGMLKANLTVNKGRTNGNG